jgi:hypothetical protein
MMVGSKEKANPRAWRPLAAGAALVMALAACGSDDTSPKVRSAGKVATSADDFATRNFDDSSINIDNRYFPLEPGVQLTFEGSDIIDGKKTPHRIVFTVTDLVKKIGGVNAVVIWDRDFVREDLEESELTFFAQDTTGTVWHLGQYREEYEDGNVLRGGQAWLAGHLKGAKAGIFMPADPRADSPPYSEGFAPAPFFWADMAQVYKVGRQTTVPAGHYTNVLVTKEYNQQEPDAVQLKYYAPGVGNVRVGWTGDDSEQETVLLVKRVRLDAAALAAVRRGALALEERANVYGSTTAAKVRPAG